MFCSGLVAPVLVKLVFYIGGCISLFPILLFLRLAVWLISGIRIFQRIWKFEKVGVTAPASQHALVILC